MTETSRGLQMTAIVAVYNEADVIAVTVGDLVNQGVSVIAIDDGSTDDSMDALAPFVGAGHVRIEPLPPAHAGGERRFSLGRILTRKLQLASEISHGWFINHDADEFRESPWPGISLADGIRYVDALGYNAIDFQVFNFWPTGESYAPGDDPRLVFRYYEPGGRPDRLQIRCWKHEGVPLDLASSAGHEAVFPGRRVFPIRFILRHYPFRGQEHAERKLFRERRPRYDRDERVHGWHVQYDALAPGHRFVRDPTVLREFNPVAEGIQLQIHHRLFEADADSLRLVHESAERAAALLDRELDERTHQLESVCSALHAKNLECGQLERALDERTRAAIELDARLDAANRRADAMETALHGANLERDRVRAAAERELRDVRSSMMWRLRSVLRSLLGRSRDINEPKP
jgi:hypothetical protein